MLQYLIQVALCSLALLAVALTTAPAERSTYGIDANRCTCAFEKLPRKNCQAVQDNQCSYPDHDNDLGITGDCLPDIPDNHQVCFRTRVKECTRGDSVSYKCRLFYNNFELTELQKSCEDTVYLSSPNGSDYRTLCMYRVNLSSNANCSSLRLLHAIDHPTEEYVDNLSASNPCGRRLDSDCRDYLRVYYGEGLQQSRVWCREKLADLNHLLANTTSFVAVYWTDATRDESVTSSFNIRAECESV